MHHTWNCMHFYKLLVIRRQKNLRSFPLDFPLDFLHLHISCNINIEGAILDPNLVENLISLSTLFALFSTLALSLCALESCRWHRVRTQALLGTHTQLQRTYKASERGRTHDCTHTQTNTRAKGTTLPDNVYSAIVCLLWRVVYNEECEMTVFE